MSSERDRLLRIVATVYDATLDDCPWTSVLGEIAEHWRAPLVTLDSLDPRGDHCEVHLAHGLDPDWARRYVEHFHNVNIVEQRGSRLLHTGHVGTSQEAVPDDELARSEWFNDFLRPQKVHHSLGGCLFKEPGIVSFVSVFRPSNGEAMSSGDRLALELVVPHLQRGLLLQRHLDRLETQSGAAFEALAAGRHGLVLLRTDGRVLQANDPAREILSDEDGLTVGADRRLEIGDRVAQRRLSKAIAAVRRPLEAKGPVVLAMPRPSGRRPYRLLVAPVGADGRLGAEAGAGRRVLLLLSDPERHARAPSRVLELLFELTPAEADLAAALASGVSLLAWARQRGVAYETARSQLKAAFSKTGTRRQRELATLVHRLAWDRRTGPLA